MISKPLDELGNIDWGSSGNKDMSNWLVELTSQSKEICQRACEKIEANTTRLGTTSFDEYAPAELIFSNDISYVIVPFLIGLINKSNTHCGTWIFTFLYDLADNILFHIKDLEEPYKTRASSVHKAIAKGSKIYKDRYYETGSPKIEIVYLLDILKELDSQFKSPPLKFN